MSVLIPMTANAHTVIAFDADDTLWPNEGYFRNAELEMIKLIQPYYSSSNTTTENQGDELLESLYQQEVKNLHIFGYGAKGFTLSMIESAIELSNGRMPGTDIQKIINIGKSIMTYHVELIPGVTEVLDKLGQEKDIRLMLITKGDLFDQESKIARSGLADRFEVIEIVSEKNDKTYQQLLNKHNIQAKNFWMVGNSVKSDVLPVVNIGGTGVHVPAETTWIHESVELDAETQNSFHTLNSIRELPELILQFPG